MKTKPTAISIENLSIRYKLILVIMLSSVLALALATLTLVAYEIAVQKRHTENAIVALGRTLEVSLHAAVSFDDKRTAEDTLATLSGQADVLSAHVFDNTGALFASYFRGLERSPHPPLREEGIFYSDGYLDVYDRLEYQHEVVGTLCLRARPPSLAQSMKGFSQIILALVISLLIGAFLLSDKLQRYVSRPIFELENVANAVRTTKDYSLRAPAYRLDEIGRLASSMNEMLATIEQRDKALERELSDRLLAERALADNEERYRALFEYAPDAILTLDVESMRFVEANQNALGLFGLERGALFQLSLSDLSPEMQPDGSQSEDVIRLKIAEALAHGTAPFEWTHRTASGKEIACEVSLARMPGPRALLRVSVIDVTRRKGLEEELRQAQKMEAFGLLAGGVAHDFNNLLTAIMGYADMAMRRNDPEYFLKAMRSIYSAGGRATALTRQLLAFSRKQVLEMRSISIADEIVDLSEMLRRLIGENIELTTKISPDLWPVRADSSQIQQVLVNLVVNARDALPNGGRIDVRATNSSVSHHDATAGSMPLAAGDYVRLAVSDNGVGMCEEVRRRIFEPFFTTKEVGKGSGLGLSTVYGIVRQHAGHISAESAPGGGTTFTVLLPRAAEAPRTKATEPEATGGLERILLVEDEEAVRDLANQILSSHGYQVIKCASPSEAIAVAERESGRIDLLLSDVIMPSMNGLELFDRLRQIQAGLPALFMSGYSDDVLAKSGAIDGGLPLLQKPFSVNALLAKVRECLDAARKKAA